MTTMDAVKINARDFVDESRPVVDSAMAVAQEAARQLRGGACVVVSVRGVRGVSSSFFNVILSVVAEVLRNDFSDNRFDVETETPTQRMVYARSFSAFADRKKP